MNLFVSTMRTLVPLLAGWVLSVTQVLGVDADSTAVAGGVSVALAAVYYAVFRGVEAGAERLGWGPARVVAGVLLGWARPPQYDTEAPVVVPKMRVDTDDLSRQLRSAYTKAGFTTPPDKERR